jgi:hypothetical protein
VKARNDKEEWSLEMTNKVLTFNKLYHDKERNRKIHRATNRLDSIGDTDGTGCHIMHGHVEKRIPLSQQ